MSELMLLFNIGSMPNGMQPPLRVNRQDRLSFLHPQRFFPVCGYLARKVTQI